MLLIIFLSSVLCKDAKLTPQKCKSKYFIFKVIYLRGEGLEDPSAELLLCWLAEHWCKLNASKKPKGTPAQVNLWHQVQHKQICTHVCTTVLKLLRISSKSFYSHLFICIDNKCNWHDPQKEQKGYTVKRKSAFHSHHPVLLQGGGHY